ncbi:hypothetical protein BCF55_0229 [Hydrogenivirga caldilitoris]|uniref:Uncharacterized protein n=1 Tax=Hydrogenivirga caldilitoris TaxID=246264 RepID=A0A497XPC6_9AQUI|nr:hypothetical protein [Hydrogenivirga caldilitoris]RLJ69969.1 hypothetical protein BCF55_0229 [Hydrogenivirga caldilitoris]
MGIFKEDIINFGNLINTEVEVKLTPEDFRRVYPDLEFLFSDRLMRIRGKKKSLLFKKSFEFRGGQDEQRVYNVRKYETEDMGIYLKVMSKDGLGELTKREGMELDGDYLKVSVFEVLKRTKVYKDVPDAFRGRLVATRYKVRDGYLSLYITVTK